MKEDYARSILRLIAVVTILVGVILATLTVVGFVVANRTVQSVQVQFLGMASIALWGAALYRMSSGLARHIVR